LPLEDGWVVWCTGCDWNVAGTPASARPTSAVGQLLERAVAASGDRLAAELARSDTLEPRLTPALAAAYVLAAAIQVTAFGLVGAALVVAALWHSNPFILVIAAAMLGFGWLIRPRRSKPLGTGVITATEAPLLYRLAADIAGVLETAPPDVVIANDTFNASWATRGIRRRGVLTLGLPLLAVLEPQERVAVIAHELAHGKHGDVRRSSLIASALGTLAELYRTLTPGASALTYSQLGGFDLLARPLLWIVAQPVKGLYSLELHLLLRDMQRAEYLADARGASVAGTAAMLGLHDVLLAQSVVQHAVSRAAHDRLPAGEVRGALAAAVRAMPSRERARRRRAAALERVRLGETHPPTAMRIDLLESRATESARYMLDHPRSAAIDDELAARYAQAGAQLIDGFRSSLYR
jgi:Zn-dependent protease with chaperone function